MTSKILDEEQLIRAWGADHCDAALAEGWSVFDCGGSEYGRWQVMKCDEPHDDAAELGCDSEAWKLILEGTGAHHAAAIDLMCKVNVREFKLWCNTFANKVCIPPNRVPFVIATLLRSDD